MATGLDEFLTLLDAYRATVRAAAWQEDHGTHGDGRLAAAQVRGRKARADLVAAFRA